jgi:SAM-dependent methyltransferase
MRRSSINEEGTDVSEKVFSGPVERLRSPERQRRVEVERVVDLCLEDMTAQRVVDVGVGSGLFAEAFARRGLSIIGVDINPVMLDAAREHVPDGHFEQAEAGSLPFADASADLVFLGFVLHEVNDAVQALREAYRVTTRRVAVLEWPYRDEEFGPPLDHRLPPERVEQMAREAGFSAVEQFSLTHVSLYRLGREALRA